MAEDKKEVDEGLDEEVEASWRFIKKWIAFGVLLFLVIYFPYFLISDFRTTVCKTENRQLTDEELIDRFLFKDKAHTMTFEEKVDELKERNGAEYPYCCRIEGEARMYGPRDSLMDKLYGEYLLEMSLAGPSPYVKEGEETRAPYHIAYLVINACGESGHDSYGLEVSEARYEEEIEESKRYWRAMKE